MTFHVYHYCAQWQVPQRSNLLSFQDGLFRSKGTIETFDCYRQLKEIIMSQIPPSDRPPSTDRIIVLSLSYLGTSDA